MLIKTRNTIPLQSEKTFTTNLESAGTNVLRWKNASQFSASWAIQVGETGEEQSEIVLLGTATPSGTAGTLTANDLYEHSADTPLYAVKYNQVVFERSTSGTAGTATPMTDGTITIQADSDYTQFDDTSGSSTYAYRTYFRNSVLNVTTTESDWITSAGLSFYSLGKIRERIRNKLWNADFIKDDDVIDDWVNEWLQIMVQAAVDVNEDYSLGTVDVPFDGTNGYGTITNADFKILRECWITYNGADFYRAQKDELINQIPNQTYNSTHPFFWMTGDNTLQVKPDESGGTARIRFYSSGTVLVNDTDNLPVYMRGYTKSFVDYGLSQALAKDGKIQESSKQEGVARSILSDFRKDLTPRNRTGETQVNIVESIDEDIVF